MDKDEKKKLTREEMIAYVESRSDDYEPDGKFGNDPEYMAVRNVPIKKKNSDLRTIRIDEDFLAEIKETASDEGFDSYQTFVKVILKRYIKDKKNKREA